MKTSTRLGTSLIVILLFTGCMDGPFYAMKRVNPFFQSKWQKDREYGPTFEDRVAEFKLLKSQLPTMTAEKQEEWAQRLETIVREDPSPEIRSRAVTAVAVIPSKAAERALNSAASTDDVEKVRMAACRAWQDRGGEAARDMLLSLAANDESNSVRQAAIDSLDIFDEPEVMRSLATLLDDNSPAIQYQVAQTLQTITGENHGGDFDAWKQYMEGALPAVDQSAPGTSSVQTVSGFNKLPPLP